MKFVIGLDGGWSKTAGVLCNSEGVALAQHRGPGSAIIGMPSPEATAVLNDMIDTLCAQARVRRRDVAHVGLGLSGIDYPDETISQHVELARALATAPEALSLVNDGVAALWGVSTHPRTALVQHGSGVTTAYRPKAGLETIFDNLDVASMYDIRHQSFAQTARMLDGRMARSLLADRVLEHCGVEEARFAEWTYREPHAARACRFTTPKVVFGAWADGDPTAAAMVRSAAEDYVLTVQAMAAQLGPGAFCAAFGGGVINQGGPAFIDLIHDLLASACPDGRPVHVALAPEYGAAVMAAHRIGLDFAEVFESLAQSPGVCASARPWNPLGLLKRRKA